METKKTCIACGEEKVLLLTSWICPTYNCGTKTAETGTVITTGTSSTIVGASSNTITMKSCYTTNPFLFKELISVVPSDPACTNDPPNVPLEVARDADEEINPNPDLSKLVIHDWTSSSLYSTLEIDSHHEGSDWFLFEYSRSQAVPESGAIANLWHTNIPRSGSYGLPQGWAAVVNGWRISSNWSFENPVIREWAFKTSLHFVYRHKTFYQLPLSDFLEKGTIGKQVSDVDRDIPADEVNQVVQLEGAAFGLETVKLRENLDYSVRVESCPKATADLRQYLNGYWLDRDSFNPHNLAQSGLPSPRDYPVFGSRQQNVKEAISKLETIIALLGRTSSAVGELEKVRRLLVPSATLSLRVHLNCALRRTVV